MTSISDRPHLIGSPVQVPGADPVRRPVMVEDAIRSRMLANTIGSTVGDILEEPDSALVVAADDIVRTSRVAHGEEVER